MATQNDRSHETKVSFHNFVSSPKGNPTMAISIFQGQELDEGLGCVSGGLNQENSQAALTRN